MCAFLTMVIWYKSVRSGPTRGSDGPKWPWARFTCEWRGEPFRSWTRSSSRDLLFGRCMRQQLNFYILKVQSFPSAPLVLQLIFFSSTSTCPLQYISDDTKYEANPIYYTINVANYCSFAFDQGVSPSSFRPRSESWRCEVAFASQWSGAAIGYDWRVCRVAGSMRTCWTNRILKKKKKKRKGMLEKWQNQ